MQPILNGVETEYGLYVEGRGAHDQIDDAMVLVRAYPDECFAGWDYRHESPRADLRGFSVEALAEDPEDRKFDAGRVRSHDVDIRSDRILPNGARFYNDHGHPEFATPESFSLAEMMRWDFEGQSRVLAAGRAFAAQSGRTVKLYKNNTDFHGASYGTHESYLVPRSVGFEKLCAALMPMLVARQILTGAGKVGSEHGKACAFQISQRADFFMEPVNLETLYRRPVFNTRDEPHADPAEWMRLHVISCDANMMPACTARRVGLVKLAILLLQYGEVPSWTLADPVRSFEDVSKDESFAFKIPLKSGSWTTAYEILESYFAAAEASLPLEHGSELGEGEIEWLLNDCRLLLEFLRTDFESFSRRVDWAAKRRLLETVMAEEGIEWRNPSLVSYDLEYHNVDPEEGLYFAWEHMGEVDQMLPPDVAAPKTRAWARGLAVSRFSSQLKTACWRTLTLDQHGRTTQIDLPPHAVYPEELSSAESMDAFVEILRTVC